MKLIQLKTEQLKNRWNAPSGYRELLKLAFPLILSTGSTSIQHFIDRMFLTWYSPEAIAATVPGGIVNFTLMCLIIGTAAYVNTFVAQYYGAKQYHNIAPAVWQGIYFAIVSGIFFLIFIPLAAPIFNLAGHVPEVRALEIQYFKILCLSATPVFLMAAISGFFGGRGETWTIMWVHFFATGVNIILDYFLIFGNLGFPQLGMKGAAIATVASAWSGAGIIFFWMLRPKFRQKYATFRRRHFKLDLFKRLMRFGLPNGAQFMLDMLGFTMFILLVGRFGTFELAATNIAFNINSFAFMPMIGVGIAVEITVGQRLGENNPGLARFGTYSALHLTFLYMSIMALSYVLIPEIYIFPFASQSDPVEFAPVREMTIVLLRFVALYSIFDTMNIIFANALKGAGDTRFVMMVCVALSWVTMIIPAYFASVVYNWGIYVTWWFVTLYITCLGIIFYVRFLQGKWESMRVIEEVPLTLPHNLPENPAG